MAGDLYHDARDGGRLVIKSAGGLYVEKTEQGVTSSFGVWDKGELTGGVMTGMINGDPTVTTAIKGDHILVGNGQAIDPSYRGKTLDGTLTEITTDFTQVNTLLAQKIDAAYIQSGFTVSGDIIVSGNIEGKLVGGVDAPAGTSVEAPTIRSMGAVYCDETTSLNVTNITKSGTTITVHRRSGGDITFEVVS